VLPLCWFDEESCEFGLQALSNYHAQKNEKYNSWSPRPVHDWASHGSTAFATLAKWVQGNIMREEGLMFAPTTDEMRNGVKNEYKGYEPFRKRRN
jgi:hypothetical protein